MRKVLSTAIPLLQSGLAEGIAAQIAKRVGSRRGAEGITAEVVVDQLRLTLADGRLDGVGRKQSQVYLPTFTCEKK